MIDGIDDHSLDIVIVEFEYRRRGTDPTTLRRFVLEEYVRTVFALLAPIMLAG
jgi:hypothetical protein